MTLLLRSTVCLLAFCALYHAALPYFPFDHPDGRETGLALAERNRARARGYLESKTPPKVVLVGSSISAGLRGLPSDWYNVAQAGGTPLTGLRLVARHSPKPQWVLIETNRIQYPADGELLRELFDPRRRALHERFPAFRNRPSHIAMLLVKAARDRWNPADESGRPSSPKGTAGTAKHNVLQANLELLSEEMPAAQLEKRIEELKESIETLRVAGTRVAFVEVPEHPAAYATPLKRQLMQRMEEAFPDSLYPWAPRGDPSQFSTTDGVHLDEESGQRFARQLRAWTETLPEWEGDRNGPQTVASHGAR